MIESTRELPFDQLIDRIVDGSLRPGELRLALSSVDREPDGWKRCTLAFLEAQCWREALRALEVTDSSIPGCEPAAIRSAPPKYDQRRMRSWRSAAAAGLIAASFVLGWLSHVSGPRDVAGLPLPASASPVVAQEQHDSPSGLVIPASVDPPRPDGSVSRFAGDRSPPIPSEIVQTVARLQIGTEGGGATVPILAGPGINGEWLQAQPPPLSEHERIVLQRHGYQVDQRRSLLIGTFGDGRRVSVPIDQVQIRYTGTNPL
jgi:hypothetical protein